ncbi:uncharacterized protein CC84DRAFT_1180153 [Paraphaeosphaeria sporulosa]|uniref:Uncharacterized protein n=1 Tax=Paraphaeosphaeria sporulosa TaxID=1460663 RepID=A0A177C0B7_9PLEO|nr:uncharacterized protein CC84DRAFT_1180153 [Paraphaeosphaeria sporulosa]OAG01083.1 hypothetical protein CC84DRAFT_1180153 [Paraphaeosphaeria sporulosa]
MATNRITVVVTLTDYTTVFPTRLHSTSVPGVTTTLTLTDYTTVFPSSSRPSPGHTTPKTAMASIPSLAVSHSYIQSSSASSQILSISLPVSRHSSTTPSSFTPSSPISTVSSSLEAILPSFVFQTPTTSTFSSSITSSLSSSSSSSTRSRPIPNPGLPTGWRTPEPAVEKHYNDVLPILMILWLVFIALFFLGALVYFAWRFARGHCADCNLKTAEVIHLKAQLAGRNSVTSGMVKQREAGMSMGLGRGQEVSVSKRDLQGEGTTFRLHDPERGIHVKLSKEAGSPRPPPHSESEDPFYLENAVPVRSHWSDGTIKTTSNNSAEQTSAHSATALFRSGLSMEENRALALAELERNHSVTKEELKVPIPFWKRTLARVDLRGVDRVEKFERDEPGTDKFVAGPEYRPSMRGPLRTFSRPGPPPAPPVIRAPTDPYVFYPRSAYFQDTGDSSSGRGSSNVAPKQYPQPTPQSKKSEFITVGLDDDVDNRVDMRRAAGIRYKHRTSGYRGIASLLPEAVANDLSH